MHNQPLMSLIQHAYNHLQEIAPRAIPARDLLFGPAKDGKIGSLLWALRRLVKGGWVERVPDPEHGGRSFYRFTDPQPKEPPQFRTIVPLKTRIHIALEGQGWKRVGEIVTLVSATRSGTRSALELLCKEGVVESCRVSKTLRFALAGTPLPRKATQAPCSDSTQSDLSMLSPESQRVLDALESTPLPISKVTRACRLPIGQVFDILAQLEELRYAECKAGGWVRAKKAPPKTT